MGLERAISEDGDRGLPDPFPWAQIRLREGAKSVDCGLEERAASSAGWDCLSPAHGVHSSESSVAVLSARLGVPSVSVPEAPLPSPGLPLAWGEFQDSSCSDDSHSDGHSWSCPLC